MGFISGDAAATHAAGQALGALVEPGDVLSLCGDLGAGKTALVKGIADGMGVTGRVTSPTFNILMVHAGPTITLNHFDLYRLEHPDELVDIDLWGVLESGGVSVIEWGDRFDDALPPDHLSVAISILDADTREFDLRASGPRSEELARQWTRAVTGGERS